MTVQEFVTEWPQIEENQELNEHLKNMTIFNKSSPFIHALNMPFPQMESTEDYINKLEKKLNKIKTKPPIHAQVLTDAGNFYSKITVDDLAIDTFKTEDDTPSLRHRTSDEYNSDIEGQHLLNNSNEARSSIESNVSDAPLLVENQTKSVKKAHDYLSKAPVWHRLLSCCVYMDSDEE